MVLVLFLFRVQLTVNLSFFFAIIASTCKNILRESFSRQFTAFLTLNWIVFFLGEPDLYLPTDDETLCMLLRPCKFYPESAFRLVNCIFN